MPDLCGGDRLQVVAVPGIPGPRGEQGEQGPAGQMGPPGNSTEALAHVHTQTTPADEWVIEHNLIFIPNVTVVDSAGTIVEGDVRYPVGGAITPITVTFSGAFSGQAYLS